MYLALYRKYRPQTFDEVVGQKHIVRTLINQIKTDKIGHAYLFCGSRGTGKTSIAKIFARAINCPNVVDGIPCGKCDTCLNLENNNMDILEIDAASNNGVDEIRDLREKVKYPPVVGKYKVYIIDEVHMLSPSAFNALLKTLEEPPAYVVFILATTEVHKLPATILSRCMRFDFGLLSNEELSGLAKKILANENVKYEDQAIELIVRAGEGSVRDMLSIADMCISFSGENLTYKNVLDVLGTTERETLIQITNNVINKDMGGMLTNLDAALSTGKRPMVLAKDLIMHFRDLLVILSVPDKSKEMVVVQEDIFVKMKEQAHINNFGVIVESIKSLSEVEQNLRYSNNPRIVLETALIKVVNNVSILDRLERLEKGIVPVAQTTQTVQRVPQSAPIANLQQPKVEVVQKSQTAAISDDALLGELFAYLREQKSMSLLAAVRQIKEMSVANKQAIIVVDDDITKDMICSARHERELRAFFEEKGLSFIVRVKSNNIKRDVDGLKNMLGGDITIED